MNAKKLVALFLALLMVVGVLAACGKTPAPTTGTDTPSNQAPSGDTPEQPVAEQPATPFEVSACIASEPETIDPSLNSSVDGATYIQHCFETLMKYTFTEDSPEATISYGQAKSHTVSADGLVYTFTLRDDIFWSDGKPVVAGDFVYGWQRLVDPAHPTDYMYMIDMVKNSLEIQAGDLPLDELGIKALDDKTVEITLTAPCAYFLDLCSFGTLMPLRKDIIDQHGDQWTFSPETYIGNGPYKMEAWNHDESLVMVKNDKYYDYANLGPDRITWVLMDDQNAMLAGFRNGTIDFVNEFPVNEIAALKNEGLVTIPYLGSYCAVFQTEIAPLDNPLVREALSLVIDRNYIVEQVTQTGQQPGSAWVPSGINDGTGKDFRANGKTYISVDPADYEANCERARALLAEAGYPGGEGFPIIEYKFNTSDAHQKIAEALSFMWKDQLNVTTQLVNEDWNVFLETRTQGEFEIARHGWIADYNDANNFLDMWISTSLNNYAQWKNPEYDALIAGAMLETDMNKRAEMMHQAEDLMFADHIIAPLYFYTDSYVLNPRATNLKWTSLGYYFFMYMRPAA